MDGSELTSTHPEAGLPWLARGTGIVVVDATKVRHRVHLVPYFGADVGYEQAERSTYLLNTGFWRTRGKVQDDEGDGGDGEELGEAPNSGGGGGGGPTTSIYSVCPTSACKGRVRGPQVQPGVEVTCPHCGRRYVWG